MLMQVAKRFVKQLAQRAMQRFSGSLAMKWIRSAHAWDRFIDIALAGLIVMNVIECLAVAPAIFMSIVVILSVVFAVSLQS